MSYHVSALFISNDGKDRWTDDVDLDLEDLATAEKAVSFYKGHNRRYQYGKVRFGNYRRVMVERRDA